MFRITTDDNVIVKTSNNESALSVLNNAVRGKSLSYDAPFYCKEGKHPKDGVTIWLSDKPEEGDDTAIAISPVKGFNGEPELAFDCGPWVEQFCPYVDDDTAPADDHDQPDHTTTPDSLPDHAEVQEDASAIRDNLDELVLFWAEDAENGIDLFFGEARDLKADRQLCIRPYLDENGKPQVRFVCYFNYMKKDKPQQ